MASLTYKDGRATVQVDGPDGKRHSIRLGGCTRKQAVSARLHIEKLRTCRVTGSAPEPATAEWIAGLPYVIRRRIEKAGLVGPLERRKCPTFAVWVRDYIDGRTDVKPNSLTNFRQAEQKLVNYFGTSKFLDEITPGDADDFRIYLKGQGLSEGTIRRLCKRAKTIL